jgi:hypothetical protein
VLLAALTGGVWFIQQPPQQRAALACRPIEMLQEWMAVPDSPMDDFGHRMNQAFAQLRANCPEKIGTPVASLADQASARTSQAVRRITEEARTLTNRRVEAVLDGERLKIQALGEARLLGVTVPKGRTARAVAYLKDTVLGRPVAVQLDKARDPERRPLILVTLPDGALLNAQMVKYGLAEPWKRPGPWRQWSG